MRGVRLADELLAPLRVRLIDVGSMGRGLRFSAAPAATGLVLSALALVLTAGPLAQPIVFARIDPTEQLRLPVAALIAFVPVFLAGSSLAIAALLHGHWLARGVALALFAVQLLLVAPGTAGRWQVFLCAFVATWTLLLWLFDPAGRERQLGVRIPIAITFAVVLAVLAAQTVLGAVGAGLVYPLAVQTLVLGLLAYVLVFVIGGGLADMARELARPIGVAAIDRRGLRTRVTLAVVVPVGVIVVAVPTLTTTLAPAQLATSLAVATVPALPLVVLVRRLRPARWAPSSRRVPHAALLAGAAFFAFLIVPAGIFVEAVGNVPPEEFVFRFEAAFGVTAVVGIVPLTIVAAIMLRRPRIRTATTGLFLLALAVQIVYIVLLLVVGVGALLLDRAVGVSWGLRSDPALLLHADQVAVACLSLGYVSWRTLRGGWHGSRGHADLRRVVALNVALALVALMALALSRAANAGDTVVVVGALLMVIALLWDFAMSGEEFTNGSSRAFPRQSRVMLYAAYVLVVGALVVLTAGLAAHAGGDPVLEAVRLSVEGIALFALIFLGVPLLLTDFALGLGATRVAHEARREERPPRRARSPIADAQARRHALVAAPVSALPFLAGGAAMLVVRVPVDHRTRLVVVSIFQGAALLALLITVLVCWLGARRTARLVETPHRVRAGVSAAVRVALAAYLASVIASLVAQALDVTPQLIQAPPSSTNFDDVLVVLGQDLLYAPPLIGLAALAGWVGARRASRGLDRPKPVTC